MRQIFISKIDINNLPFQNFLPDCPDGFKDSNFVNIKHIK